MILTTYAIIYLYICYRYHYTRFVSISLPIHVFVLIAYLISLMVKGYIQIGL